MANIVFTPTLMNAINAFNALNNDERATFASYVMAQNSVAHVQSAPIASAEQTPSVPTVEEPKPKSKSEQRTHEDTTVYVELSFDGKGVEFLMAPSAKGRADRCSLPLMHGVRAQFEDVVLKYDKALVSKDTYHSDTYGAYGDHKHGAYKLFAVKLDGDKPTEGKAFTKAQTEAWVKAHPTVVLTAEGKAQYHADKDAKKADKERKELEKLERLAKKLGKTLA